MKTTDKIPPNMFTFYHSYAALAQSFYSEIQPTPSSNPTLLYYNVDLDQHLRLNASKLSTSKLARYFSGNTLPSNAKPIATVYAAHQFGSWVSKLGDGRAILLGEVRAQDQKLYDIQLKGAGQTPYSRRADGRATLGSVLRECLVSEFMHAVGIASTRALAVTLTGDNIMREALYPSAVLSRTAKSHIRYGTFQYFSARGDTKSVQQLADYVITRLYPHLENSPTPYLSLLKTVATQQAKLIAQWQLIGFIHGVMNTDNTTLSCETLDYGPCAFMDQYHENTVFSSIDQTGRYAYKNQPAIAQWNLSTLAECLLPLLDDDVNAAIEQVKPIIEHYATDFYTAYHTGLCQKIGLPFNEKNLNLAKSLLQHMQSEQADFTLSFRALSNAIESDSPELFEQCSTKTITPWLKQWRQQLKKTKKSASDIAQSVHKHNPLYIPRNHQIESVIQSANQGDYEPFHHLMNVLNTPFTEQADAGRYALPPHSQEIVHQTFCGT